MKKRLIALLLAVVVLGAMAAPAVAAPAFSDVSPGDWFYNEVNFVTEKGLIDGNNGRFEPNVNITRATYITALYALAGKPATEYKALFSDVPQSAPHSSAVIWASNNGIVQGYPDGTFKPGNEISRAELVTMIYRYQQLVVKFNDISADISGFSDVRNNNVDWALEAMTWAYGRGLINGRTASTFVPNGTATRAEGAAILRRYIELPAGYLQVLNPKPTRNAVVTTGLAPRLDVGADGSGWAGKTLVVLANYNASAAVFAGAVEKLLPQSYIGGADRTEKMRLIYVGDLRVISNQTTNPSTAPNENWETFSYNDFRAGVKDGTIKPDAVISAAGF